MFNKNSIPIHLHCNRLGIRWWRRGVLLLTALVSILFLLHVLPMRAAESSRAAFDLIISLYNNPSGDDDPLNNMPGGEEQIAYENIIRFFADAVYEQSNGVHRIRRVRIFRNGAMHNIADILWNERQGPEAYPSGFGYNGYPIFMGDIFPNGFIDRDGAAHDLDLLADPESAGYCLGHEFGHYVYGLYDEYRGESTIGSITQPRSTDTPAVPAIMNNQWEAAGGNFQWINHSTSNNYQGNTAQGRVYEASCWEVMVRPIREDPVDDSRSFLPERTHYTLLDGHGPAASDTWGSYRWMKVELPDAAARDQLEIIWMEEGIEMEVVIDRSDSMAGDPFEYAKEAAKTIIHLAQIGSTAVGVVSFGDNAIQEQTMIFIDSSGLRSAVENTITFIDLGGYTALYDGVGCALTDMQNYAATHSTRAHRLVFNLSDGMDTCSVNETIDSLIAAYQAADVPMINFGYGPRADEAILRQLSDNTGGHFYSSGSYELGDIQDSFLAAHTAYTNAVSIIDSTFTVPSDTSAHINFEIDSTLKSFFIVLRHGGDLGDLAFQVKDPGGNTVTTDVMCECIAPGVVSCKADVLWYQVKQGGYGSWSLVATSNCGEDKNVKTHVHAWPHHGFTYDMALNVSSLIQSPEPAVITISLLQQLPITGITMVCEILSPSGALDVKITHDDGLNCDTNPDDGIYTVMVPYTENGYYQVNASINNHSLDAFYTSKGSLAAPNTAGRLPTEPALPPIVENFQRSVRGQFKVEGYILDPDPRTMPPDNTPGDGEIDYPGDEDKYIFKLPKNKNTVIRVFNWAQKEGEGEDTVCNLTLTAKDSKGNFIGFASMEDNKGVHPRGYLYVGIQKDMLKDTTTVYATVKESSGNLEGLYYRISAGDPKPGEYLGGLTTFCDTLGDSPNPNLPDEDIFHFKGLENENMIACVFPDPTGTSTGYEVGILVSYLGAPPESYEWIIDVPGCIDVTLHSGPYVLTIMELADNSDSEKERFLGDYCVSFTACEKISKTIRPGGDKTKK
ncbi:MAG: vWA domain-containing protein [bacterium]